MSDLFESKGATFSPCRTWRYELRRTWGSAPALVMLMLNPSTADETKNDPTVERCERRARGGGFGGLIVLNIFAFRATDPADMKAAADPIGPENDDYLTAHFIRANAIGGTVCAAWGVHGSHLNRAARVLEMARHLDVDLMCLKQTKEGHPGHPLYIASAAPFIPFG